MRMYVAAFLVAVMAGGCSFPTEPSANPDLKGQTPARQENRDQHDHDGDLPALLMNAALQGVPVESEKCSANSKHPDCQAPKPDNCSVRDGKQTCQAVKMRAILWSD